MSKPFNLAKFFLNVLIKMFTQKLKFDAFTRRNFSFLYSLKHSEMKVLIYKNWKVKIIYCHCSEKVNLELQREKRRQI